MEDGNYERKYSSSTPFVSNDVGKKNKQMPYYVKIIICQVLIFLLLCVDVNLKHFPQNSSFKILLQLEYSNVHYEI